MFRALSDRQKAGVFSVLAVMFALGAAWLIRALALPSGMRSSALYMGVPAATVLLMLLVVTRDGYTRAGWASLGLHRLGLRSWGVAVLAPVLVGLVGTAIVWATPLASFVAPDDSLSTVVGFFVQLVLFTLTLSLGEELGWRGYLLPRLLSLGRHRALLVTGLVWAAWHLPLIYLTPLYHADGNRWLVVPLFVATIVAGSFVFGYLRLWTGSMWPAALAHSAHNGAWGTLAAFTVTTSPVVVNEYLVGDNGLLILVGTALVAWWLGRRLTARGQLVTAGEPESVMAHARR
jgi:CAAX protease family protein